jgi:outer membrane protein OmpA-like peptidoglycan-associated protein
MLRATFTLLACLAPIVALADAILPDVDVRGARDPAGLPRYEGSLIVEQQAGAYDDIALPLSPLAAVVPEQLDGMNNTVFAAKNTLELEGTLGRTVYLMPVGRTPLEVLRNYQQAWTDGGGERLYECKDEACGGDVGSGAGHGGGNIGIGDLLFPKNRIDAEAFSNAACAVTMSRADLRYAVGRVSANGRDTHVAVLAWVGKDDLYCKAFDQRTFALVLTVEAKAREQKMVTVKAADLSGAIADRGRIALYGIHFDVDKADLRADSRPQLDEIAALLRNDATLKLQVVGHTDNQGDAAHNDDLSLHRAEAVVVALTAQYGIAADRLVAQGKGSSVPVASNGNEEGRARNRRVELVKR